MITSPKAPLTAASANNVSPTVCCVGGYHGFAPLTRWESR
jgi:hypothetical protein